MYTVSRYGKFTSVSGKLACDTCESFNHILEEIVPDLKMRTTTYALGVPLLKSCGLSSGALQGPASALRRHALRGTAPASPPLEAQGHSRGLHPARGDERVRGASRQRQGPRALLEAPLMARHHLQPSGPHPPTMPSTQRSGRLLYPRRCFGGPHPCVCVYYCRT